MCFSRPLDVLNARSQKQYMYSYEHIPNEGFGALALEERLDDALREERRILGGEEHADRRHPIHDGVAHALRLLGCARVRALVDEHRVQIVVGVRRFRDGCRSDEAAVDDRAALFVAHAAEAIHLQMIKKRYDGTCCSAVELRRSFPEATSELKTNKNERTLMTRKRSSFFA